MIYDVISQKKKNILDLFLNDYNRRNLEINVSFFAEVTRRLEGTSDIFMETPKIGVSRLLNKDLNWIILEINFIMCILNIATKIFA